MSVHNEIRNLTLVQAMHANKVGFGLRQSEVYSKLKQMEVKEYN